MTPEQQAAFLFSQSISVLATIEGMRAHNLEIELAQKGYHCQRLYNQSDFENAASHIGRNGALSTLGHEGG